MTTNKNMNDFISNQKTFLTGTNLDIYGDDYSTEINPGKLFVHLYNELYYTYTVNTPVNVQDFVKKLVSQYKLNHSDFLLKFEQAENKKFHQVDFTNSQYFIKVKEKLLVEIHNFRVGFWYGTDIDFKEVEEVINLISVSKKRKVHAKKFYMIAASQHSEYGFDLQKFDVKKCAIDIESNYNDDFNIVHETIAQFLKKDGSNGLVLLHGKFGTGKTTYLRHLISSINKRFIFLPLNLMDAISSPSFLPFISQFKDSVLILEDCEDIITPRESATTNNNSLVNLLNLGDGLLSDALSIKIICTFNSNIKQIDRAILRKGRLIARYEFKELEMNKVQKIYEKLGYKDKADKIMTLADIYNKNTVDYGSMFEPQKMGF